LQAWRRSKYGERGMFYEYSEFGLELSEDWKEAEPIEPNLVCFDSELQGASITLSAMFYQIPPDKIEAIGQQALQSRIAAHAEQFHEISYLRQSVRPHSSGTAFEVFCMAEAQEGFICFLGYVTERKILNFFIEADTHDYSSAATLFNKLIGGFGPVLP
jgi:hypothetical protein